MSNFWIGFIVGGFICGLVGFLGAAILATSSRASRREEKIEEDLPSYREDEDLVETLEDD